MNEMSDNAMRPTPMLATNADGQVSYWAPQNVSTEPPLLTQYLRIALRWKWVILASMLLTALAGLVFTMMMTPQFTAATTIEIAREADRVVKVEGAERESNASDLEFYQTQYGLLKARSLAERVGRELRLADDPKFFEAFQVDTSRLGAVGTGSNMRFGASNRDRRAKIVTDLLLGRVTVTPVRASRLVAISYTSPSPELSAKIADSWAKNFIESNLERRFGRNSYARTFLEERLNQLRQKLEESERNLVTYAENQQLINIPTAAGADGKGGSERSLAADDLSAVNTELAVATADRIKAESRVRQGGKGAASNDDLANAGISSLRQKRAEVAAEYAKMMVQFEPGYPAARALQVQITQLDRSIAIEEGRVRNTANEGIQGEFRQAVARERALAQRVASLKNNLVDQKRRSIQYNIYQREVDTNRTLYDGLLQQYKENGIAAGVGSNNVSVVDSAKIPESQSSPNLPLNLLASIIAGLALGGLLAFALEQMDEAINDPGEIQSKLGLPLLGVVPKTDGVNPVEALEDRKSDLVESYLSIQTNLEFTTSHGIPRSISVTSTRPAEGKSTTAYAIALSLARGRKKVVLIDADMRSPSVHHVLNCRNEKGLSNYLSGGDLDGLIHKTSVEGFAVMTAGPQPPNAAELLTGDRLAHLIELLHQQKVDHVVVDSPPVMGLADAPLIASQVEGTVYAVEARGIRSSLIRVALGRLRSANSRILGIILTKFNSANAHIYSYGYDYGYGYGRQSKKQSAED